MLTNIIALTVLLASSESYVTNVTEFVTRYERYEPVPCPDAVPGYGCLVLHQKGVDPIEKDVTTEVFLRSVADVKMQDKLFRLTNDIPVSKVSKHYYKGWVETDTPTNYLGGWGVSVGNGITIATNSSVWVIAQGTNTTFDGYFDGGSGVLTNLSMPTKTNYLGDTIIKTNLGTQIKGGTKIMFEDGTWCLLPEDRQ